MTTQCRARKARPYARWRLCELVWCFVRDADGFVYHVQAERGWAGLILVRVHKDRTYGERIVVPPQHIIEVWPAINKNDVWRGDEVLLIAA